MPSPENLVMYIWVQLALPGVGLTEVCGLWGLGTDDLNLASSPPPNQAKAPSLAAAIAPFPPGPQPRHQLGEYNTAGWLNYTKQNPAAQNALPAPTGLPEMAPLTLPALVLFLLFEGFLCSVSVG